MNIENNFKIYMKTTFSYSAIETFNLCPLKYKLQNIDKISTPQSEEQAFGSALHRILKEIYSQNTTYKFSPKTINYFKDVLNASFLADKERYKLFENLGERILNNYFKKNDPQKTQVLLLERHFSFRLFEENNKEFFINGIIDRVDKLNEEEYEIVDYKTSKRLKDQTQIDEDLQLSIYALGLKSLFPDTGTLFPSQKFKIKLSLYFLVHNLKLSTIKTEENLNAVKETLIEIIKKITISTFEPTPGNHCSFCLFQKHCPYWKHKYLKQKDDDLEHKIIIFAKLNDEIKNKTIELEKLKTEIKETMQNKGLKQIFSHDYALNQTTSPIYEYDAQKIQTILGQSKYWTEILKIDKTKLKCFLPHMDTNLQKKIDAVKYLDKEVSRLSLKKIKPKFNY